MFKKPIEKKYYAFVTDLKALIKKYDVKPSIFIGEMVEGKQTAIAGQIAGSPVEIVHTLAHVFHDNAETKAIFASALMLCEIVGKHGKKK